MLQTPTVKTVNISAEDLRDIRETYEDMIAGTDFQKVVDAMNILDSTCSYTVKQLKIEIEKGYQDIMKAWGPPNENGSLNIDLENFPSAASAVMGAILSLTFSPDHWRWRLNLFVNTRFSVPKQTAMLTTKRGILVKIELLDNYYRI